MLANLNLTGIDFPIDSYLTEYLGYISIEWNLEYLIKWFNQSKSLVFISKRI